MVSQAAVVVAVLALCVVIRVRLLALLRLLTRGGSVMRNLLARSLRLHPIHIAPRMHSPSFLNVYAAMRVPFACASVMQRPAYTARYFRMSM